MIRDLEQSKNPEGHDGILSKLRQRLKEKEKALEVCTLLLYSSLIFSLRKLW